MAQQQQGAAAPPVQRLVESTTICYAEVLAPAGQYTVTVVCSVTRSFEFWRRGGDSAHDVIQETHAAGDTPMMFAVTDLADLQSAAACRDTLRGMLAVLPQLRSLRLAEDELDAVVPEHFVPEIVRLAHRGVGFTSFFRMKVHRRVMLDERGLVMACKERLASTAPAPGEKNECAICLDGLEQEPAVQLPGCDHMFHRRCISEWFSTAATCPICRGDVLLAAVPQLIELSSTIEPAQGTTAAPDTE